MKRKFIHRIKKIAIFFLLLTLCLTEVHPIYADETDNVIEIKAVEDFLKLAENCKLDVYSIGKVVELKDDINLSGNNFSGIPYFNGTFHGNGFTISGIDIDDKGSQIGLFRYLGELGIISDLKVTGAVVPTGSQVEVGGIAGVNYGTIQNCYFEGTVCGVEAVGTIVGINKSMGKILSCNTNALVLATDFTGGIAGINEGLIDDCINKSRVNIEELETVLDLGGIDLGTLNLTQNVVTRNNMGGIAGKSTGVISNSRNYGEIGYAHTGYNVGGIAGSQSGVIHNCTNDGKIYGRKDVGGIVGQAEPYIESEYLSDQIEQTKNDLDRMNRTLTSMSNSLESTSEEAKKYADALTRQYEAANGSLSDRLNQMENAIPEDNAEAKECMDNITKAQNRIQEILDANENGNFSEAERQELIEQQRIIEENTRRLEEISREESSDSSKESVSGSSENTDNSNLSGLSKSIQDGIDTITKSIDSLNAQADSAINHIYDSTAVIRGEKDFITDISSIKNAATMDGVISECVNRGIIEGDLNVGGIAGTMNIEYDDDPEEDFNLSEDIDIATSSGVNDIIISCINYGKIKGKKNCLGSIAGLQEFGLIYGCEGYGHVIADSGSYIGGIAGKSGGTIEKSYSMADLSGTDYLGGIVGEGASVIACLSIEKIDTEGERIGGIAGYLKEGGTVEANYFVKDQFEGIDNISYFGVAEPKTYEEIMQIDGVPNGFKRVRVTYEADGEVISERMVPYGSSLTVEDFPLLIDREDAYAKWPEESVYTDIKNNVTIEAEYVPWNQSAASDEQMDEKSLFIAVAHFYEGAKIKLESAKEAIPIEEGRTLLYSHSWRLFMDGEKEYETVEGHFYIPQEYRESEIEIWAVKENDWVAVETEWDGSYAMAEIPFEAPFAVVVVEKDNLGSYLAVGAATLVLLLVISGVIVHNKRKRNVKIKRDDIK